MDRQSKRNNAIQSKQEKQCKATVTNKAQACLRRYKYNIVYGVPSLARE